MKKYSKTQHIEELNLNSAMRANALYDIWQLLSLIDRDKLTGEQSAIISCAMSRAWEAGTIDFTEQ